MITVFWLCDIAVLLPVAVCASGHNGTAPAGSEVCVRLSPGGGHLASQLSRRG